MMAELKFKYRNFCWEYGKSPYQVGDNGNGNGNESVVESCGRNNDELKLRVSDDSSHCAVKGGKIKAMVLTNFCYNCHS